jgi:cell division protein FtsQ
VRRALLGLAVLALALLAVSRFWPTVQRIETVGGAHHDRASLLRLARVAPGDPLLWITRWRVDGLSEDPWIRRARVTRHWPDAVAIAVWERTPLARSGEGAGATVWAEDGTVLPGARESERASLPVVRGWGGDRVGEALTLLRLLKDREPKVIQYTPEGFEIALSDAVLFTPGVAALRRQWAAVERHRGGRLAVYPWGVSRTHE